MLYIILCKDKLTSYNGTAITYDEVGNPLSYRDGMSFTWEHGRQLSSLQTDDNSVNYKYDSNGMRTQKTDNNGTTNYYIVMHVFLRELMLQKLYLNLKSIKFGRWHP